MSRRMNAVTSSWMSGVAPSIVAICGANRAMAAESATSR